MIDTMGKTLLSRIRCKNCKKWTRHGGDLHSEWNLCEELSQNTLADCFLIPRSLPELKDSTRVRMAHTYKDFGCVFFVPKVLDESNETIAINGQEILVDNDIFQVG